MLSWRLERIRTGEFSGCIGGAPKSRVDETFFRVFVSSSGKTPQTGLLKKCTEIEDNKIGLVLNPGSLHVGFVLMFVASRSGASQYRCIFPSQDKICHNHDIGAESLICLALTP